MDFITFIINLYEKGGLTLVLVAGVILLWWDARRNIKKSTVVEQITTKDADGNVISVSTTPVKCSQELAGPIDTLTKKIVSLENTLNSIPGGLKSIQEVIERCGSLESNSIKDLSEKMNALKTEIHDSSEVRDRIETSVEKLKENIIVTRENASNILVTLNRLQGSVTSVEALLSLIMNKGKVGF